MAEAPTPQIDTPCVDVCRIAPKTGLCLGCRRSLDEIARWRDMGPDERARIMAVLASRSP